MGTWDPGSSVRDADSLERNLAGQNDSLLCAGNHWFAVMFARCEILISRSLPRVDTCFGCGVDALFAGRVRDWTVDLLGDKESVCRQSVDHANHVSSGTHAIRFLV